MALTFIPRIFGIEARKCGVALACLPKFSRIPSASMTSKENRDPDYKRPAPWPYKTRKLYQIETLLYESTTKRFDDNTKVVIVEGPIGAGKSAFAKEFAERFDMMYLREPSMDDWYITQYGYDIRELDDIVPPSYVSCDIKRFYSNPHHPNVSKFQMRMFALRVNQYVDGLTHLLNTGQGVVLERCAFSDYVFVETMYAHGYLSKEVKDVYYLSRRNILEDLPRPHLIIYLDVSPEVAMERIKKRNDPVEVNSKVLTKDYLETIDHFYKHDFLQEYRKHSEVVVYDWSHFGDVEVVVEDIERINFDRYTQYDTQFRDWLLFKWDYDWGVFRRRLLNDKNLVMKLMRIAKPRVTELYHPCDEVHEYSEIMNKVPGEEFAIGYNASAGENPWFKLPNHGYGRFEIKRSW